LGKILSNPPRNILFWIVAIAWLGIDLITKYNIVGNLQVGDSLPIWQDVFHFTHAINTGAAFSFFHNSVDVLKWISLITSVLLAILGFTFRGLTVLEQFGYGSILGGAIGNGFDRFTRNHVVDFLDVRLINFPIFNFADMAISLGLVCLLAAVYFVYGDRS
jgi:signal peptidase II